MSDVHSCLADSEVQVKELRLLLCFVVRVTCTIRTCGMKHAYEGLGQGAEAVDRFLRVTEPFVRVT